MCMLLSRPRASIPHSVSWNHFNLLEPTSLASSSSYLYLLFFCFVLAFTQATNHHSSADGVEENSENWKKSIKPAAASIFLHVMAVSRYIVCLLCIRYTPCAREENPSVGNDWNLFDFFHENFFLSCLFAFEFRVSLREFQSIRHATTK